MDRREKSKDLGTALLLAMQGAKTDIWTALPGIVQSFDPVKRTCSVQPALQSAIKKDDMSWEWVTLPLLVDCPVIFPGGGGYLLTFPIGPGDEVLVIFASRCIDHWWASGGIQVQAELRMHDLSDGFCLPAVESVPSVTPLISTTGVELRSKDGAAKIRIGTAGHDIEIQTPGDLTATVGGSVSITADGDADLAAAGTATITAATINLNGTLVINGTPFLDHVHAGIIPGASNTLGVV